MRLLFVSMLACALPLSARAGSPAIPPPTGVPASFLAAHLGVDTHVQYTDGYGMYADPALIQSSLQYLGVNQIRDGLPSNFSTSFPAYQGLVTLGDLSLAGVQFDLILADYTNGIAYDRAALDQLFKGSPNGNPVAPAVKPGSVIALEGLNEINNQNPQPSMAQANAWQQQIYCLAWSARWCTTPPDPNVAGAAVVTYTGNQSKVTPTRPASLAFPATVLNVHPYAAPSNLYGENLYQIEWNAVMQSFGVILQPSYSDSGVAPSTIHTAFTESGAYVEPVQPGRTDLQYLNGYDAHTMAIKDLDTALEGMQFGATTYLYQLFDNYTYDSDNQYGLFTYGGQDASNHPIAVPTLAAQAIHNLMGLTKAYTTMPTSTNCLRHTFIGLPPGARSFLVQADNTGDYAIVLWWDNPMDWDKNTHQEIPVQPASVVVSLAYQASAVTMDPVPGGATSVETDHTMRIPVSLGDDPLVIGIHTDNPSDLSCQS